ncbi:hypothetical protein EYF80_032422 [Liparis tanakae]|uniref:Uncharacterized protein n=1 Tax=Liparis tanakae TaxID=230148 RepID=A0A4Z2GV07_9TELE|nr:hypothetical protein EYF80_032422 [Liparis tanakae]
MFKNFTVSEDWLLPPPAGCTLSRLQFSPLQNPLVNIPGSGHQQLHLRFCFGVQDNVVDLIKRGSLENPTIPLQNLVT